MKLKHRHFLQEVINLKTLNITADGTDSGIEANAFKDCTGLTSVTINNIATIANNNTNITTGEGRTVNYYTAPATVQTPAPLFQFKNSAYKGVTVKLNTYDYDTYYGTLTDEAKRLEAHTLETQYHTRYLLNDLNVDEFTAVLKGGTDVNALKPIKGADFKRYNDNGMYYSVTNQGRTYIIRPTGIADFKVYYRNDDGNIVYVFDSEATEKELDDFSRKDKFVTSKLTKIYRKISPQNPMKKN